MSNPPSPVRVLLVDDHPIVRAGIKSELQKVPGVEIVGEASDGHQAMALVESLKPAVVFMDISMPNLNGLEATLRITRDHPEIRVVILSRHEAEEYFWGALKAGAVGYLLKRSAVAEIAAALRQVDGGEIYLSRELSERMVKRLPLQQAMHRRSPWRTSPTANGRFCS